MPKEIYEPAPIPGVKRGQYIIRMREGHKARGLIRAHAIEPLEVYDAVFEGFAARLNEKQASALERNPHVASVELDGYADGAGYWKTQNTQMLDDNLDPWGLDRIDQQSTRYTGTYRYLNTGEGVTAYVLDTGIDVTHPEFEGRAYTGYDAFGGQGKDVDGHGTHVAGTIGGKNYGVAKGVRLVGVKVLDDTGSGTWSGIIAGIEWVMKNRKGPSVACMSLGGGKNTSVNAAVDSLVKSGVTVVVASGNNGVDASNTSPASAPLAITVGASTRGDFVPRWSNWGPAVDLHAPGLYILSATPGGYVDSWSGTSMAAPHVAGVACLLMDARGTDGGQAAALTPAEVRDWLLQHAHRGRLQRLRTGSPDRLLHKARL